MGRRSFLLAWAAAAGVAALLPARADDVPDHGKLVELGRRLFMDPTVSRSGRFSCASCHDPEHGFSDPRVPSVEHDGPNRRHSQPLTDLVDGTGMHRDGEFDTVRELLEARLLPGSTASFSIHGLRERHFRRALREGRRPDAEAFDEALDALGPPEIRGNLQDPRPVTPFAPVADRLRDDDRYAPAFEDVFGTERPTIEQLIDATEAYVLSLRTGANPVDRFLAGEIDALTAQERRGHALFAGDAGCTTCHALEPDKGRAPLTDLAYHDTGVAFPGLVVEDGRRRDGDGGRGEMTHVAKDLGRFKTPSLRDVARRAPYMHDGSLATLEEVVSYYDRGARPHPGLDPAIRPLRLSREDRAALVAFLRALTSPERAGVGPLRPAARTRLRILDPHGKPLAGLAVRVVPFGDRLGAGARGARHPIELVTDRRGRVSFDFPPFTHVVVEAAGHEVGCGRPVPDSTRELDLRAVPTAGTFVEIVEAPSVPKTIEALDPESGEVLAVLRRVQRVGGQRAVYEVVDARRSGRVRVRLSNDLRARGVAEIDLSGGESEAIRIPPRDLGERGYG